MRLIIHAPGVRTGGGKTLLEGLLRDVTVPCEALLDERLIAAQPQLAPQVSVHPIRRDLFGRLTAELSLQDMGTDDDIVLCFANLPPLFRCRGAVFVFLQNRYLVEDAPLAGLPTRTRLKIRLDRAWLRLRARHARAIIVQTASMALAVSQTLRTDALVMPFRPGREPVPPKLFGSRTSDGVPATFLYVASGEPHKNHHRLIQAWAMLARDGVRPGLVITLQRESNPRLYDWICEVRAEHRLAVEFASPSGSESLARLYSSADALIYPSLMESFGLPLMEAVEAGLPILASERDYVRDVVSPAQSFDPESAISIARALRRFLAQPEATAEVDSPAQFLSRLMKL
jgi:glycosyltransferase involved in cell wall biosynthesis